MLISAIQKSDSDMCVCIHIHILFYILFHYGLSQNVEYSSLLYRRTLFFIHLISVPLLIPNSQSISPLTPLTSDRLCPLLRSGRDALQL